MFWQRKHHLFRENSIFSFDHSLKCPYERFGTGARFVEKLRLKSWPHWDTTATVCQNSKGPEYCPLSLFILERMFVQTNKCYTFKIAVKKKKKRRKGKEKKKEKEKEKKIEDCSSLRMFVKCVGWGLLSKAGPAASQTQAELIMWW